MWSRRDTNGPIGADVVAAESGAARAGAADGRVRRCPAALGRCDAESIGAYLESSNERNHAFYQRHGRLLRRDDDTDRPEGVAHVAARGRVSARTAESDHFSGSSSPLGDVSHFGLEGIAGAHDDCSPTSPEKFAGRT